MASTPMQVRCLVRPFRWFQQSVFQTGCSIRSLCLPPVSLRLVRHSLCSTTQRPGQPHGYLYPRSSVASLFILGATSFFSGRNGGPVSGTTVVLRALVQPYGTSVVEGTFGDRGRIGVHGTGQRSVGRESSLGIARYVVGICNRNCVRYVGFVTWVGTRSFVSLLIPISVMCCVPRCIVTRTQTRLHSYFTPSHE